MSGFSCIGRSCLSCWQLDWTDTCIQSSTPVLVALTDRCLHLFLPTSTKLSKARVSTAAFEMWLFAPQVGGAHSTARAAQRIEGSAM